MKENNTPKYELDDGPLTDEQMEIIRKMNPTLPSSRFTKSLFDMTQEEYAESLRKRGINID